MRSLPIGRTPPPTFNASDRPPAIVDAVGRWLAATDLDGFRWVKSRRVLVRAVNTQRHELTLQTSTFSRTGVATWVMPRVSVFDDRLTTWRQANPSASAFDNLHTTAPCAYSNMLVNAEPSFVSVELSGLPQPPEQRAAPSVQFFTYIATVVRPLFDASAEPPQLVAALPDSWLSMVNAGTVEWAMACGNADAATELIQRSVSRPLRGQQRWDTRFDQFRHGWGLAEHGMRPELQPPLGFEAVGWLARTHSLLALNDLLTPPAPHSRWRRFKRER